MPTIYTLIHEKTKTVKQFNKRDDALFKKMNDDGYGVFFSVNEFGEKRTKDHLEKIRYAYCDVDIAKSGEDVSREEKERLKQGLKDAIYWHCEPTMIIDTSNGLQPLWEINDATTDEEGVARYIRLLKGIRAWAIEHGSAGDNVYDVSRVIRLPGYNHMKAEPYMCEIIYNSGKKYVLSELEQMFPYKEEEKKEKVESTYVEGENPVFDAIRRLDFQEIIIRAFASTGRPVSFDEDGRLIDPVGGTTGTFQGRHGDRRYLASSSHEPYKGNEITAIADILGITYGDAFKWICSEFNITGSERAEISKYEKISKKRDPSKRFTWGTEGLNRAFAVTEQGDFIVCAAPSGAGKTTFTFFMACKNAEQGNKTLYLSLEVDEDKFIEGLGRKRAGITPGEKYYFEISESKQRLYEERMEYIRSIKNLELSSIRRHGGSTRWCDLEEIIIESNPDIVFIDNLDLISANDGEDEMERQNNIVKNIMAFTSLTGIVVVLVHHFRKMAQGTHSQGLDDMRGSGKIRDGIDRGIVIRRNKDVDAVYPEKFRTTVSMEKGRGWDECARNLYFIRGEFVDEPPSEEGYYNGVQTNLPV